MKIRQHLKCYLNSHLREYYVMESNKGKTNFDELAFYLSSDFTSFFSLTKEVYLQYLYSDEGDNEYSTDSTICCLDTEKKIIYIASTFECDEYIQENWTYEGEDPSTLDLIRESRVTYDSLSLDNFLELMDNWYKIWKGQTPFALLYQDEKDWIHCKEFDSEEEMDQFIKQHN